MKNDGRDRDDGEETNELSFVLMRVMFVETQVLCFTLMMLLLLMVVVVMMMIKMMMITMTTTTTMMMKWKWGRWS